MQVIHLKKVTKPLHARVQVPGSLSQTIRALAVAAMIPGSIKIVNPVKSDDSETMVSLLNTLGIAVEEGSNYFIVHNCLADCKKQLYNVSAGLSGRTARIALALLTLVPGEKILTCDTGFKNRPIGALVSGLSQLGAKITYLEKEQYLPVSISSSTLHEGTVEMDGSQSSQFFSAVLLIAPLVGNVTIHVRGKQSSRPFIDMTIQLLKEFGISVENDKYQRYVIPGNQQLRYVPEYTVEADAIAATYFWGLAALTKSRITVLNISPDSFQGDRRFTDILRSMGAKIIENRDEKWIAVQGTGKLSAVTVNMNDIPDSVPTLAVVAAYAQGQTIMQRIKHLRLKESDRLENPKIELERMGISAITTEDSLMVHGGIPHAARIHTYNDHRMAMAFSLAGLVTEGITIENPDVVSKSFPDFWKTLQSIGIQVYN